MRYLPAVLLSVFVTGSAGAGEITSAYTALDAERDCIIVGYIVATGNRKANEKARQVADEHARFRLRNG
mgnify:CR=1 FL=1